MFLYLFNAWVISVLVMNRLSPEATTNLLLYQKSDVIPPSKNLESPKMLDPARPKSMPRDTIVGKISSAISSIASKAVSAKNVVASKLEYGVESDKGVSVKEYWSEKLSPGEEDRVLSEAITDVIQKRKKGYEPSSENTGVVGRVKGWLGMSSGTQNVSTNWIPEVII